MPNPEEKILGRVVADLQQLDQLRGQFELTKYQQSDSDHAEKFTLLEEIAKLLQPLAEPLTGLAGRQNVLATAARLDDLPIGDRTAYHGDWPIVTIARIRDCERFDELVYILDGGYALARHNQLDSGEDGFELVFHLSDETGHQLYCRNASHGTPEVRLTLRELKAIYSSLPFGLINLQQRLEQEKAAIREEMERLTTAVEHSDR